MLIELGHYGLILALLLAAAQACFGLAGPALGRERWQQAARFTFAVVAARGAPKVCATPGVAPPPLPRVAISTQIPMTITATSPMPTRTATGMSRCRNVRAGSMGRRCSLARDPAGSCGKSDITRSIPVCGRPQESPDSLPQA